MATMFRRGLATALWSFALYAVAFGASLLGLAVIASTNILVARWLRRPRRARVGIVLAVGEDRAHAGIIMSAGMRARTLDEVPHARVQELDDTMDLVRMDGDGGWQRAPPPAPKDSRPSSTAEGHTYLTDHARDAMFKLVVSVRRGSASSIPEAWERYPTIEQARTAGAPLARNERVFRVAVVRNEVPPAFVEWLDR